jgi:FemAB-related protein (PEP-CTERM system-associated)
MGGLSLMQLSDRSKDLWNDFVSANPYAHVYHLWEWGDVLSKTYDLPRRYLVVKKEHRVVGVLPFFYVGGLAFGDKIVSLPFCEYGGPLADFSDQSMAEDALLLLARKVRELAKELRVDYVELRHSPSFSAFSSSAGFRLLRRYVTFRLDLREGEMGVWRSLDGLTRRRERARLRRAERSGTEVKDVDSLRHYYELYLRMQKRHGSPPHSYAFFENLYAAFESKGLLRMLLAVSGGKPIAGIAAFSFKDKVYCWNNVLDRRYASSHPTDLLLWYLIRWGAESGFRFLDLGRTRLEDRGVYYFKKRWGGKEIGLEDYVFSVGDVEFPDPLQRRYVLLSRFWSLLPHAIARRIGPHVIRKIGL